ncbi:MAG: hypothetical protein WD768_04475 [Phycisphaeraceae bacterium]
MGGAVSTSSRRSRKQAWIRPRHRRQFAAWLTWGVVLLQTAMLVTLAVTPTWQPPRVTFFELIWAWMHQPTFYPFAALLIGGPALTILAWTIKGWHRAALVVAWCCFAVLLHHHFGERVGTMWRVIVWQYS